MAKFLLQKSVIGFRTDVVKKLGTTGFGHLSDA
jgi:hypothetical protein